MLACASDQYLAGDSQDYHRFTPRSCGVGRHRDASWRLAQHWILVNRARDRARCDTFASGLSEERGLETIKPIPATPPVCEPSSPTPRTGTSTAHRIRSIGGAES